MRERRPTSTSSFGVGRRESHDASGFYRRFHPPVVSDADDVLPPKPVAEPFVCGDARAMPEVADGSVALVVTSPPYFAGKQYEEELEREGVPGSYLEYLQLLTDVFAECVRTLEPGGRIAVNVANLGRKPYRSLSADVVRILQDELGLLLRGELVWQKGEGATGSCAWGSFRSASNPVLRDLTERVVVASKGRFDRARSVAQRRTEGLPHRSTLPTDDFLALDPRPLGDPRRERAAGRSSGALPGRAARAADPPLHLRRRSRPRPVHGQRFDARGRRADSDAATSATTSTRPTSSWRASGWPRRTSSRRRARPLPATTGAPRSTWPRTRSHPVASRSAGAGRASRRPASRSASRRQTRPGATGCSTSPGRTPAIAADWRGRMLSGGRSVAPARCGAASLPTSPWCCSRPSSPTAAATATGRCGPPARRSCSTWSTSRSPDGRARLARYASNGPAGGPQPGFWTAKDLDRGEGGCG